MTTPLEQIRAVVRASEWSIFSPAAELRAGAEADETIRTHAHDWLTDLLDIAEAAQTLVDLIYPAAVFDGSSGDPGAVAVANVRAALAQLAPSATPQKCAEGDL